MYEKRVDGLTCEQRVREDRKNNRPMGKKYYDGLRDLYASEETPSKKLKVECEGELLMPQLEVALLSFLGREKDSSALVDFFDHAPVVTNQKSVVVLLRAMAKIPPLHPPTNTQLHMSFLAYFAKHNMKTRWPNEFETIAPICDAVLGKSFRSYKNSDLSAVLWWQGHKHIGSLLIPSDAMDKCCNVPAGSNWDSVEHDLHAVVNSCSTGDMVFGFALKRMMRDRASNLVGAHIAALHNAVIDENHLQKARLAFQAACRAGRIDPAQLVAPYTISVKYRSISLDLTVRSATEEYLMAEAIQGQSCSLASDKLRILP